MTTNYFTPIINADPRKNDAAIWNDPLGELDAAILSGDGTIQSEIDAIHDEIDAIIIGSGSSPAEVIAARTGMRYKAGSPPAVLQDTIDLVAANTILVDAYGAVGDGVTNDAPAIALAFAAAVDGDTIVFSAGRTYKMGATVTMTKRARIVGNGATLDCTTLNAVVLSITTTGRVTVDGLRFLGPVDLTYPNPPVIFLLSRAIAMTSGADRCTIINCYFSGFMQGGVFINSHYNVIANNHFEEVRHFNVDWLGVIYSSGGNYNTIMGNVLEKVWDGGIHLRGGSHNTVIGNIVEGSNETLATTSMGLRASLAGLFNKFIGNTVRNTGMEGIIVTGAAAATSVTMGIVISGNTMIDCRRSGITLDPAAANQYVTHCIVSNNYILARTKACTFGILMTTGGSTEYLQENQIIGNVIVGLDNAGTSFLTTGISNLGAGNGKNCYMGNRIKNVSQYGMQIGGIRNTIVNNVVEGLGANLLRMEGCQYAIVAQNTLSGGTNALVYQGNVTGLVVENNQWDLVPAISGTLTGTYMQRFNKLIGGIMFGSQTLASGTRTFNPGAVGTASSEGIVEVWRKSFSGTAGALYVSAVDQATTTVTVKSTSASDNGDFYWQITR